ncbi:charged multivesicular body protein 7 isoform X2 [Petromyzon marinus]|uniref:Charged multivesicular body protein 7 isoform X2 n=1 Tax=Petromyzon marinus TaxID=7757 RepID=A0AAJ7WY58_PETMA|nr:charged multivesicular body protein 7 isoform X2 [Petromyzon marinus]
MIGPDKMYDPAGSPVRSPPSSPISPPACHTADSPVHSARSPVHLARIVVSSPAKPPAVHSPVGLPVSSPACDSDEAAVAVTPWPDEERRRVLFAAFKAARAVNPADWDGRLRFWRERMVGEARASGDAALSLARLQHRYADPRPPLGLATVLREMMREGALVRESEMGGGAGHGWLWGAGRLALTPLRWARDSLLGGRGDVIAPDECLILPSVVEEAVSAVLAWRAGRPHAAAVAVRLSAMVEAAVWPNEATLCMALRVLQQRQQLTTLTIDGVEVVKFAAPGAVHAPPLSPVDVGVMKLEMAQGLLGARAHAQRQRAHTLKEEARAHVREGSKRQALRCLRACKRVQQQLERVEQQQESLEHLLESVHAAHTDAMVIQAFQAGKVALHKVLQSGPDTDAVDALMDEIQQLKEEQEDVSHAISQDISGTDDLELEEELSALLLLEEAPPTTSTLLPELPQVPQAGPDCHGRVSERLLSDAELDLSRLQIHGDVARSHGNFTGLQASDRQTSVMDAL